jgi:site-specific DNA-cytosine methylase
VPRQVCPRRQRFRLQLVRHLEVGLARHLLPVGNSEPHLLPVECLRLQRTVLLRLPDNTVLLRLPDNTALLRLPDNTALLRQVGNSVARLPVARADNTVLLHQVDSTVLLPAP